MKSIALWPLAFLERKIRKGNRLMIRWAIRRRTRLVYLFALFWSSIVSAAFTVWVIWSIPIQQAGAVGATMVLVLAIMRKLLIFLSSFGELVTTYLKYWDHYQRQFEREPR